MRGGKTNIEDSRWLARGQFQVLVWRGGADNNPGDVRPRISDSPTKVAAALVVDRLRLAPPEVVTEATGYRPGGVPPIGHRQPLKVVIDRHVFGHDVVYGGGGDEWHMLRIEPRSIQRLTGALVADVVEEPAAD